MSKSGSPDRSGSPHRQVRGDRKQGSKPKSFLLHKAPAGATMARAMGLSLEVGILADLKEHDPEGAQQFREEFETLNRFLASEGLPPHHEPESCEVWSGDMWGYSGLHYLRR